MFKKDEYNQEEYHDYYQQEVAGAELKGGTPQEEEKGGMGKIIAPIALVVLAIGGYFGYNMMGSQSEKIDKTLQVSMEENLPQSTQADTNSEEAVKAPKEEVISKPKITEVVETPKTETIAKTVETSNEPTTITPQPATVQTAVTQEVQKAVATTGKMSPEEVASIVAAVMLQMNQAKTTETTTATPIAAKQDVELMKDLSDTDVDSVSADLIKELENINLSEDTEIDNSDKKVDVYNKVNVQSVQGDDTLSQLSNEISNVINEGITQTTQESTAKSYTESLKSEVDVRQNEMRIMVVKRGDTLGKLAKRAYGNAMDFKKIYRANPELTRPDRIYVGQKLRIPN